METISCDLPQPLAGLPFTLTIMLDSISPTDIVVSLEKQRIVANARNLELRPTGTQYFERDPKPVKIAAGVRTGTSDPIAVRRNAVAEPGDPAVHFPERLLFSAFVRTISSGFACTVVSVSLLAQRQSAG